MILSKAVVAGMLILHSGLRGVQASDALISIGKFRSESSKSSIGDKGKFMAHHLNNMEHGGRSEASMDHDDPAEETTGVSSHADGTWDSVGVIAEASVDSEDKDVNKLFTHASNKHIGLSAIGIALLSLAAMLGVRMRRGMETAIDLASSSGHGIDMSRPLAPLSVDNISELKSQDSLVGSFDQVFQGSEKALAKIMHADIKSPCAPWDPFGLGEPAPEAHVENFRESEQQHGRVAMTAAFLVSPHKLRPMQALMQRPRTASHRRAQQDDDDDFDFEAAFAARVEEVQQSGADIAAAVLPDEVLNEEGQLDLEKLAALGKEAAGVGVAAIVAALLFLFSGLYFTQSKSPLKSSEAVEADPGVCLTGKCENGAKNVRALEFTADSLADQRNEARAANPDPFLE